MLSFDPSGRLLARIAWFRLGLAEDATGLGDEADAGDARDGGEPERHDDSADLKQPVGCVNSVLGLQILIAP